MDRAFAFSEEGYKWNIVEPSDKTFFEMLASSVCSRNAEEKWTPSIDSAAPKRDKKSDPRNRPLRSEPEGSGNKPNIVSDGGKTDVTKGHKPVDHYGCQKQQIKPIPEKPSGSEQVVKSCSKELLLSKLKDAMEKHTKGAHEVHWVHFLDSGGQSEFHDVLPLFVHGTTVIMYVTDLSKQMDQQAKDDMRQDGNTVGKSKYTKYQREQVLERMIQSVIYEKRHHGSQVRLMVIGTHRDDIESDLETSETLLNERNASIKNLLQPFVEKRVVSVVAYKNYFDRKKPIRFIYPINGKTPCKETKEVARTIREHVVKHCSITKHIPTSWFLLEEDLRSSSNGILTMERCEIIAGKLNISLTSLKHALKYFHQINIFWYFSDSNDEQQEDEHGLSNWIFTDTLIPVKIVSAFVELAREENHTTDTMMFIQTGQFEQDVIFSALRTKESGIIKVCEDVGFKEDNIMELLENMLVIACIKNGSPRTFLMPCILEYHQGQFDFRVPNAKIAPRAIKLKDHKCIPCGFFCALICSLIRRWVHCDSNEDVAKIVKSFRDYVEVDTPTSAGVMCNIKIVDSFRFIEVHVQASGDSHGIYEFEDDLTAAIEEVAEASGYDNKNVKNALHYLCDCDKSSYHVAELRSDNPPRLLCDHQRNPEYLPSHKKWKMGEVFFHYYATMMSLVILVA